MERRLTNKALRHWRDWLPNKYAELNAANQLISTAAAAAHGAAREIRQLMNAGARRDEAEEIVLPKWILLMPEEPDEDDELERELAELEAAYQERMAPYLSGADSD